MQEEGQRVRASHATAAAMAAAAAAELQALQGAVAAGDLAKASALLSSLKARALRHHATRAWVVAAAHRNAGGRGRSRRH